MSSMERNKGKLIPLNISAEHFTDETLDSYYDNGCVVINNQLYTVEWEVNSQKDCFHFADVKVDQDGAIEFHTYHDNGGGSFSEVIESVIPKGKEFIK